MDHDENILSHEALDYLASHIDFLREQLPEREGPAPEQMGMLSLPQFRDLLSDIEEGYEEAVFAGFLKGRD